ncbi:CynX/NimT family MFS transporter [Gaoshiqia sp. Z1-71]|uniref:CynX/NimT family MFS transporter n=1 Tax=Gaoshiqia hydrogeniformans TaxID=3290090 RepID=UPI003BF8C969
MVQTEKGQKSGQLGLIIGIILIAFNLRPAITSVGPLVTTIQDRLGINNLEAGFLTTIPLMAFALFSPFVALAGRRWGNERTLLVALVILSAGVFIRYTENISILYLGTLVIGSGIAIINVLLPSVVKSDFPTKIGLMTSLYTTAMCGMAGLASGVSIPLTENAGLGWKNTLLVWGLLAVAGVLVWLPQVRVKHRTEANRKKPHPGQSVWKSDTAWFVSAFMGLQSFVFYCLIAWLPAILHSKGMNNQTAGWMLLFVQFIGLPATFFSPIIALKMKKMWHSIAVIVSLNLAGFSGLMFFNSDTWLILSITVVGLSTGGSISIAYMIISTKARDSFHAAELSGMVQSVGYLLAAFGPVLLGFFFDKTGSWLVPVLIIQLANVLMLYSGVRSVNPRAVIR